MPTDDTRTPDPLTGLPPATCYRTHTQADEGKGVFGAVWLADVRRALAARPAPDTGLREALRDDEWADVVDVYGSFGSRLVANRLEAALADRETNHAD